MFGLYHGIVMIPVNPMNRLLKYERIHRIDPMQRFSYLFQEVLDYCVYANVEPERERLIGHSIQTWRMFHRQENKPGFW